jgi:AraC family transcriptional regulator, transcriptional activator FtrA
MPRIAQKPPSSSPPSLDVAALVYPGLCSFEYACAAEVFALPRPEIDGDWYRFRACALQRGLQPAHYGLAVRAAAGLRTLERAGTVIIPGWRGLDVPVPEALVRALQRAHARGARLLSICSGAFVLAASGLLDGRRATTHWRYAEALAQRYPRIQVDPSVLYVDEGQLLTSAGSAAGLDLCLHLVRRDFGSAIANQVARRLVIAPHRDGGQAQFVERPVASPQRNPVAQLQQRMLDRLRHPWTLQEQARAAALSERHLLRQFRAATGTTPARWLADARVARARELLEQGRLPLERVAEACGIGSVATLRRLFRDRMGLAPRRYRERFDAR